MTWGRSLPEVTAAAAALLGVVATVLATWFAWKASARAAEAAERSAEAAERANSLIERANDLAQQANELASEGKSASPPP
jgi:hypothetical protein